MYQSGYKGITSFTKGLQYDAGWCEFYYTPIENIDQWPSVDPSTQELTAEPTLKVGATWYGPIKIANQQLGYKEQQQKSPAGVFYKIQVDGIYPGDGRASRVNLSNMPHHQFILVGKQRAGGMFVLLGAPDSGLDFGHEFNTGRGNTSAITEFIFSGDSLFKPSVLPSFGSQTSTPMPGGSGSSGGSGGSTGGEDVNITEIITFTAQPSIVINYTSARRAKFGAMPTIEVWFKNGLTYQLANLPITADAAPPDTSTFSIDFFGITDGIIVLK
jgi:hypothetical protein